MESLKQVERGGQARGERLRQRADTKAEPAYGAGGTRADRQGAQAVQGEGLKRKVEGLKTRVEGLKKRDEGLKKRGMAPEGQKKGGAKKGKLLKWVHMAR